MKRRSFLSLLGAAPVAAALTFRMGASTTPFVEHKAAVVSGMVQGTQEQLIELAKEMLRLMVRGFNGRRFTASSGEARLGDHVYPQGQLLIHQSGINLSDYREAGDGILEAAATSLCNQVLEHRATTFGMLRLPVGIDGGVIVRDESGVVLRALRDYSIESDRFELRVDVLYG